MRSQMYQKSRGNSFIARVFRSFGDWNRMFVWMSEIKMGTHSHEYPDPPTNPKRFTGGIGHLQSTTYSSAGFHQCTVGILSHVRAAQHANS
jgi:hypothetical protein